MVVRSPHVLLVEDNRDIREMYSEYLSYSGMQVTEARSGRGALDSIDRHTPDVIVTDIAMPGMDGLELSRLVRAKCVTRDVPIIVVTGQHASVEAHQAGATVVLEKPCDPDVLLHVIRDALRINKLTN